MRTVTGEGWTLHCCDCLQWMAEQAEGSVDHVICDPPYAEDVHRSVRSSRRCDMPDVNDSPCRARRVVDLGFEHITAEERAWASLLFARLSCRWTLVFSDSESVHLWRQTLQHVGLRYKRTGAWHRVNGAPQFSGDRPAVGFEAITIAHRPGRSRWNGGGHQALWSWPIVINRSGHRHDRVFTAQKPVGLMLDLVRLFTDPGELVCDPFAGSGTTGVACLHLGRRFVGCEINESYFSIAVERLRAAERNTTVEANRAGQLPMFGDRES